MADFVSKDQIPLPLRAIISLVMYIEKAGGPSEMNQCLTVIDEVDHDVALFIKTYRDKLRMGGVL